LLGTLGAHGKVLTILGRADDSLKISGHLINIAKLRSQLHAFGLSPTSSTIISLPDTRRENRLILVIEEQLKTAPYIEKINLFLSGLTSPERPREVCWVQELPKTPLGKIKVGELRRTVRNLTVLPL
jgi:acyl-coenzyme A synthetase/AMP-(fatty) acid ligase